MAIVDAVLAAVIASAVLASVSALWRRRLAIEAIPRTAWRSARADVRARRMRRLRRRVLERAAELQIAVPVQAVGWRPRIVTWSTGQDSYYWQEPEDYQSAMISGRTPPARSFWNVEPPAPVNTWSRAAMESWLAEHDTD